MTVNKIVNSPTQNELIDKVNEIIAKKQDELKAGTNITISNVPVFDATNWAEATHTLSGTWGNISYGNNKFVAIRVTGYISTSNDGTTWSSATQITNLGNNDWYCLAYGDSKFVALGLEGYISTSTDGTTWSSATQKSNLDIGLWRGLTYGDGKFVAISDGGYISTSTDGTTWAVATQITNLGNNRWRSIIYGNNKFVAISAGGYISTSTDGETWSSATQITNLGNNGWVAISYTGDGYFAISGHSHISISEDGTTWSEARINDNLAISESGYVGVAYNNSLMVALGTYGYISTTVPSYQAVISSTGGGSATDVQINGTSITSNNIANIVTNTAYDSSSNKIATISDVSVKQNKLITSPDLEIIEYKPLPSGYTALDYIASSGTQYIDTGYYTKENTTIKAKLFTPNSENKNIFGGTGIPNSAKSFVFNSYDSSRIEYIRGLSNWGTISVSQQIVGAIFTLEFAPTYININGSKVADILTPNTTDDKSLCIFVRNGGSAYFTGRIYNFDIWEDNVLVMHFVPAKRNSDNVVGLYDTVSDTFFTNAGTGTFTAGAVSTLTPDIIRFTNNSGYITNTATGTRALTIEGTASSNSAAINIGDSSEATANNSTALGCKAQATANFATAIGRISKASGVCGIQIGYGTNSTANTLSIGFYNNSSTHYNWQLLDGTTGKIPSDRINVATSVSSSSTNAQVVGAKLFYDTVGNIETLLSQV